VITSQPQNIAMPEHATEQKICSSKASTRNAPDQQHQRLDKTKHRMGDMFTPNQVLGRLHSIGCVAVEITQKCNLDCTLCYLSEHSQSVSDIPLEEVYRRLDDVLHHYGPGTHVQITGGDPTLRKHTELVEIAVGLRDVAFHVDSTQRRENGDNELSLNSVRQEYIDRTKGLGLMVIFNTTVHKDNFHDIPDLVRFFRERADKVGLVSFQLQADTGRGEWRQRDVVINTQTVEQQIEAGSTKDLPWDVMQVGHTDCHHYLPTAVVNNKVYPLITSKEFIADFMRDFQGACWDRHKSFKHIASKFVVELFKKPIWFWRLPVFGAKLLLKMFRDIVKARGQVNQLTFFVQNFMDAKELVQERVDACSFMVMTSDGPVSMCEHNASRDEYILKPLQVTRADGSTINYQPLKENIAKESANIGGKGADKLAAIGIQTTSN